MKAVIMAAGKGTRMLPLTRDIPKALVPINGKPFLYHLISNIKTAGIDDIGIIAGYMKDKIEDFLEEHSIKATIIPQDEPLGTGHAIKLAKEFTDDNDFIALCGDNLWSSDDIKDISKMHGNIMAAIEHHSPEKYGVIRKKGNKLSSIIEKPDSYCGNLINTGLYRFTPDIFHALDCIEISKRGEYELTDGISILADTESVRIMILTDYWKDLGCIEDIPKMEEFIKNMRR